MSGIRRLKNKVIRANFGVPGLRHDRVLNKQQAGAHRQLRHLQRQATVVLLKHEGIVRWVKHRLIVRQMRKLEKHHTGLTLKRLALIDPRFAAAVKPTVVDKVKRIVRMRRLARQIKAVQKRAQTAPRRIDG